MRLSTIAAKVKYKAWKNPKVTIKNNKPILDYSHLIRDNDPYSNLWKWEEVSSKSNLWKRIHKLNEMDDKRFQNELIKILKEYGPLLCEWEKETYSTPVIKRELITTEKTLPEFREAIRWIDLFFNILVERVIKNGEIRLYKNMVIKWWCKDEIQSFNNGGPSKLGFPAPDSLQANSLSLPGGSWKNPECENKSKENNKFTFLVSVPTGYPHKEIIRGKVSDDEWYYLAVNSALEMIKPWVENASMELSIGKKSFAERETIHTLNFRTYSLIEALVLQFYLDELSSISYKICEAEGCNNYVPPNRINYCSDKCATKHRQNNYKDKKGFNTSYYLPKIIQGKLTIKEVSEKQNTSIDKIKEAILEYNPTNHKNKKLFKKYKDKANWI